MNVRLGAYASVQGINAKLSVREGSAPCKNFVVLERLQVCPTHRAREIRKSCGLIVLVGEGKWTIS